MSAAPAKDNKKVIVVSVFGVLLLIFVVYAYSAFFGGSTNPAAVSTPVPVATQRSSPEQGSNSSNNEGNGNGNNGAGNNGTRGMGVAPGVAAKLMANTSASLDPTLHESAMLRTESLVYSGTGRNIFSAIYTPPVVIPKNMPNARPGGAKAAVPTGPPGPPPLPPIYLKYFGTATRANGVRQAFLLNNDDVYLASVGDIVARKYKIINIGTNNIEVEDLQDNNTQSLPLQVR